MFNSKRKLCFLGLRLRFFRWRTPRLPLDLVTLKIVWSESNHSGFGVPSQLTGMLEFGCSGKKTDKKYQNLHPDSYATDQKANKF